MPSITVGRIHIAYIYLFFLAFLIIIALGGGREISFLMVLYKSITQLTIQQQLFLQTTSHSSGAQLSLDVI